MTENAAEQRELTFGEKLIGLAFNPSGDPDVNRTKRYMADMADLVYERHIAKPESHLRNILFENTIGEILNAQMNVVKFITLKD